MSTEPETIPEWERELLDNEFAQRQRDDAERLALLTEVEATEVSWLSGGIRVTLTPKQRVSLRTLLDEVRRMREAVAGQTPGGGE